MREGFASLTAAVGFAAAALAVLTLQCATGWIDARGGWSLSASFAGIALGILVLRAAWLRVQVFGAPVEGSVSRPVHGTVLGASSLLQAPFLAKDLVRVDATEGGLRIGRRTSYANVFLIGWCWTILADILGHGFGKAGSLALLAPAAICGVLLLALDPPASRRRRAVPWSAVRIVVETPEGADLHFADARGADSLSLVLDRSGRARLLAMVDGRAPAVLLPPPGSRPAKEASARIDRAKEKELDETLDRLRRM